MSGILDSKTRVLDTIITLEGRKQLSQGGINIKYVTFSDGATYYSADLVSGSSDATARVYLESCHLPQDQVTFKSDEDGRLLPFDIGPGYSIRSGQVVSYSFTAVTSSLFTGSIQQYDTFKGDGFHALVDGVLTSSIDNFQKQRAIATKDNIFDDDGFALGNKDIEFTITNQKPLKDQNTFSMNVSHLEEIFADPRFSHLSNFKYLPPVNKVTDEKVNKKDHRQLSKFALGDYKPWGRSHVIPLNHGNVLAEHLHYAKQGFCKTVNFEPTSRENRLFMQMFEVTNDTMTKMDVIDFGTWNISPVGKFGLQKSMTSTNHVFFVGRLITKPETNSHAFVHLFTLIFG